MKKYEKNIEDRRVLVARLSELTGLDAHYTRVPRCAYEIGAFTVEKDGRLSVEEGADENILESLISENLIGACIEETQPVFTATPQASVQASAQILQPDLGTEEWGDDEWEETEEPAESTEPAEDQEVWQPATDIFSELTSSEVVTETDTSDTGLIDEIEDELETEEEQEAEDEPVTSLDEGDAEDTEKFPVNAKISFPLSRHTVASLTNLLCMVYTRGPLLSKATGGTFYVDRDLVSDILDRHSFVRTEDLIAFVKEWNESENPIQGISFDEEKVTFDGFTGVRDADQLQTFTKLAAAMNKMAQTQKRVQAKETNDINEKYSLRVWLIRLGMNGPDYKTERKILMKNLTGHAAFRTKADEDKWKARQQVKKEALKAAKTKAEE